jgi:type VI protein secretion system component Hcp
LHAVFRTDRFGRDVNYYRVTLTNASVSAVRQYSSGAEVLEDDSLVFQKIQRDDLIAHTTFTADFQTVL